MSNLAYQMVIDGMTWSHSRIETYRDCPYRFFLKYFCEYEECPQFYASYGSFVHKLIEKYYKGEIKENDLTMKFLSGFHQSVLGNRPKDSIVKKYIEKGVDYFDNFLPFDFNPVAVEQKIEFNVGGRDFIGFIDFIGEKDGELYVVDNKSRELKPRSHREKSTAKDRELDEMLGQLYLYSAGINQVYGRFPKALCFNCFRNRTFIEEEFDECVYCKTIEHINETIRDIRNTERFYPQPDFFKCRYICGLNDYCEYFQMMKKD